MGLRSLNDCIFISMCCLLFISFASLMEMVIGLCLPNANIRCFCDCADLQYCNFSIFISSILGSHLGSIFFGLCSFFSKDSLSRYLGLLFRTINDEAVDLHSDLPEKT